MNWTNAGLAGAFVFGTIVGGFAVIRITRYVLDYLSKRNDEP